METKTYTITLTDGTVLSGLKLINGSFYSEQPITADIFKNNLTNVTISGGAITEIHKQMKLANNFVFQTEGSWHFTLSDVSEEEIKMNKLRSDLEYLAMMSDIEL